MRMNLKQAIEILKKHYKFIEGVDIKDMDDPDNVEFYVTKENQAEYEEFCKTNGTIEFDYDQEGGEDEGSYYHVIHKITHPDLGVAYLKWEGSYSSWDGVDWDYQDNPTLVEPKEVTVIKFVDVN